ncbi:peroxiredoxin family protein [Lysinibacillus odysseyi]|uniref:Thiol-disulfide oxidoreductase n=1 Tax=Lysinibacillus odysseyi 34hs-1 = NBRC 100172 TaxID=1220589 RepID=A0A0A3IK56_9BACI|nr:TlpA family protein disulfide reductase [Lysinibacillus odysseyi]KGR83825.1 thiol-disulfide oxidoreductase [Lysinibacillus odysseyi 34hs-1 = NBRC 100172]
MKKNIGLLFVLALVATMLGTYIHQQLQKAEAIDKVGYEADLSKEEGLQKGAIAPDFTLETITGEKVTLSDLKGKKVILNFWATWCRPCQIEMPHLQSYYEDYAKKDNVVIIAANTTYNDQGKDKIETFINRLDITFPILLMPDRNIIKTYEVLTIPSTFVIDTEGRIQHHIVGPLDKDAIRDYVTQLD